MKKHKENKTNVFSRKMLDFLDIQNFLGVKKSFKDFLNKKK
jgi:hypothetical protein